MLQPTQTHPMCCTSDNVAACMVDGFVCVCSVDVVVRRPSDDHGSRQRLRRHSFDYARIHLCDQREPVLLQLVFLCLHILHMRELLKRPP